MTPSMSNCHSRPPKLRISSLLALIATLAVVATSDDDSDFFTNFFDPVSSRFSHFPESLRLEMLEETRRMFQFGYDCYMKCAFPLDELDPIKCKGRGPDYDNPSNININDVLGDYSLTLVDALDTLAVMGNVTEFQKAVKLVVDTVSFDTLNTVQVFEANIRVLGGLLSAHLLMEDTKQPFGDLAPDWYMGDLLTMAHDLADRLLAAFNTQSGIPHPRVNLMTGVPENGIQESCTAGVGSLILEMGLLSRLLGDPIYESYARRAVRSLWQIRDNSTGLFGYVMNINSKTWVSQFSGLGAGMDSFYEYLLKSHILFDDESDRSKFVDVYDSIVRHMRRGRAKCNSGEGVHPIYVNVDMKSGETANNWVDALQAAFPGLQVLHGDVEEAICHHALFYAIWKRFDCLPERYNWKVDAPDVRFYPLRPEFMESTYLLYQATKSPFYLHVGRDILSSLVSHTRTNCGHATIHDVLDKSLEDRQESFFLSETCKYLYLLFDVDNPVNRLGERYLFTTEGHVIPIRTRKRAWEEEVPEEEDCAATKSVFPPSVCENPGLDSPFRLPLKSKYLTQIFSQFGLDVQL